MRAAFELCRHYQDARVRPDALLLDQLRQADQWIRSVPVGLNRNEHEALASLVSDILGGFAAGPMELNLSPLRRALERQFLQIAVAKFFDFCLVEGRWSNQAYRKRITEQRLWVAGVLKFN